MSILASPIAMFLGAALLGAIGQFLYQAGAVGASGTPWSFVLNWRILGGVACYGAVMALFVAAFRRGGAPSVLYPLYATTFIWAALIGRFAYREPISPLNALGMACLVAGMYLMGVRR